MEYGIRLSDFVISDVEEIVYYIKEESKDAARKIAEKYLILIIAYLVCLIVVQI